MPLWLACLILAASMVAAPTASADLLPPQIHTVAGGGSCSTGISGPGMPAPPPVSGGPCDGVSATSVPIAGPSSVAALPGGGFLYIDSGYDLVREVSPSGVVTTVAGNGTTADAPDGPTPSLAVNSGLNGPVAVAPLPGGGFLITEFDGSVVREVSPGDPSTATITTVAGTLGSPGGPAMAGCAGDGGPATQAQLNYPMDAQPTADGSILIADTFNHLIRKVSPDGTISTVAGGSCSNPGSCPDATSSCDGMPANSVALDYPDSVSPLADGSGGYLIAESDGDAIREVSSNGTFTTVAGIPGDPGYSGDGGPATAAQLDHPQQVVSTVDGGFLIADTNSEVIRAVSSSGTITTVVGDGFASYAGDGGDATAASLDGPVSVSPTSAGGLLIADEFNDVIRGTTMAPVTTIKLTATGSGGYFNTAVKVTVSAPGAKSTNCVLDPSAPPPAYGAMPSCPYKGSGGTVTGDGSHTIYAASANSFGDQENPVSVSFNIDTTPPTVTCLSQKPKFTFGEKGAAVRALVTDAGSGPLDPLVSAAPDTRQLGTQSLILTAYDVALNATGQICYYDVLPAKLSPTPSLSSAFAPQRAYTAVKRLAVVNVPRGASVSVLCRGKGCPFAAKRKVRSQRCRGHGCAAGARTVDLLPLLKKGQLSAGTGLTITVTKRGTTGRAFLLGVRAGKPPTDRTACLAPGSSKPGKGC